MFDTFPCTIFTIEVLLVDTTTGAFLARVFTLSQFQMVDPVLQYELTENPAGLLLGMTAS